MTTLSRLRASAFAAAGTALLLAGSAWAVTDLRPHQTGAMEDRIVPRDSSGASYYYCPLPPTLPGDGTTYLNAAMYNIGPDATVNDVLYYFLLDGIVTTGVNWGVVNGNSVFGNYNIARNVRGGLHAFETWVDPNNWVVETDETNNRYGRQYAWTPSTIALDTQILRQAPPSKTGGTSFVNGPVYPNCDGMRFGPQDQGYWQGVALRATNGDYDLDLFAATTGTGNGFRTPLVSSSLGGNETDFVIVNYNFATNVARDVGILGEGGTGNERIECRQSPSITPVVIGTSLTAVPMASEQMLYLNEFQHVPNAANPRILFELQTAPGAVLHLALFDYPTTVASRADAMFDVTTDSNGRAIIDEALHFGSTEYYGIAVYRDAADGGTAALTFDLTVRATPAELVSEAPETWIAPIVPGMGGGLPDATMVPPALSGNTNDTRIRYAFRNIGAQTASGYDVVERIDGGTVSTWSPVVAAGNTLDAVTIARTIRGGRHTLGYRLDAGNVIDELNETNNDFANQWVWSPLPLALDAPVTRSMPPAADGGWDGIPAAVIRYPNNDGLRSPTFTPSGSDGFWGLVAAMPGAGSDIDLQWHALSTGPTNGFTAPLFGSADGLERTELLLSDHNGALQFDVGVMNASGNAAYTVESRRSVSQGSDPPVIGPVAIPAGEIARVFEFYRATSAPLQAVLENVSGDADLGVSLYRWDGNVSPLGRTSGLVNADANGAGAGEEFVVNQDLISTYIGVVVYKTRTTELGKTATFKLHLNTPGNVDVEDERPAALAFAMAGANPVTARAQLRFDLPEARDVALEVFDIQGHRVKTLAHRSFEAGVHHVTWAGDDETGRRLGSGLYFVRFTSGAFHRVSKVTLVR